MVFAAVFSAVALLTAPPPAGVAFVASSYGQVKLLTGTGLAIKSFGRGESPAFSADASRIAFIRDGDVFTIGADGKGLTRVTNTAAIEESPDWSPDGALVYASNRSGRFELYVQRPGGAARRLTHPPHRWQEDRSPSWSPDGRWIVFSSNRPSNFNAELYLVRPDGTGLRRLTFTRGSEGVLGDDGMPSWRPDGSGIVFVSNRANNFDIYELDLRTRRTTRVTNTPDADETLPRVGPRGRFAFVVLMRGGQGRLVVARPDVSGRNVIQAGTSIDWRF